MTIDPFLFLRILFWSFLGIFLFLFLRYVLFLRGFSDRRFPIIQHADRKLPPPPKPEKFLPGSYFDEEEEEEDSLDLDKIMDEGLEITHLEEEKRSPRAHPVLGDLKDLRRAFLMDDLLNRKWDK